MDFEERKKRQTLRVLIAECGMVVAVITIVIVSVLSAMGFFISKDGQIEQSGLIQVHSLPTGATVELDGTTLFARTNFDRTLEAGEHNLKLSRDGYDSWEKTILIRSGELSRLYYPRLFLLNRTAEKVLDLADKAEDFEFYSASTNREYILYSLKDSSDWHLLDVRGDNIKDSVLDLSKVMLGMQETKTEEKSDEKTAYKFAGEIEEMRWSANAERILTKVKYQDKTEWVLVDLNDPTKSINLSTTFGLKIDKIGMIDSAASRLFILENGHLRKIDISSKSISQILVDNVAEMASYGNNIIYVTKPEKIDNQSVRKIGTYRENDEGGVVLTETDKTNIKVAISQYYDDYFIGFIIDDVLNVKFGSLPVYRENEETDLSNLTDLIVDAKLNEIPASFEASSHGEYFMGKNGRKFLAVDLESGITTEYEAASDRMKWLDASMLYAVNDGAIIVWDFDGLNVRNLAESLHNESARNNPSALDFDVLISTNNRWMYYLSEGSGGVVEVVRERIRS